MVLGLWAFEVHRGLERLERATEQVAVGKISGAVGTYANIDPRVEEMATDILEIGRVPLSTQVVQRDRHAEFMSSLAILAPTLEQMAVQIRHFQRTEVVYPENMAENMGKSHGLVFSQRVLLELVRSGLLREEAYRLVQRNAMHAWEEGEPFQEVLAGDEEVAGHLTTEQLDDCFDPSYHLRRLPIIFERIEGLSW